MTKKARGKKVLDVVLFFILGIAVGIAVGMTFALVLNKGKKAPIKNYRYEMSPISNCDNTPKKYYEEENRTIYLYCLNGLKIKEGENSLEFKNYYQSHSDALTNMLSSLTIVEGYDDGGSILYRDNEVLSESGFSILKCNTLLGNQDIYIGPKSMAFENGFCQTKTVVPEGGSFIRTYNVLHVEPSNDNQYIFITIREFQGTEVSSVRILKKVAPNITVGKNYEFKFQAGNNQIPDTILSIFENRNLLSVVETDKVGLEQIQDTIQ